MKYGPLEVTFGCDFGIDIVGIAISIQAVEHSLVFSRLVLPNPIRLPFSGYLGEFETLVLGFVEEASESDDKESARVDGVDFVEIVGIVDGLRGDEEHSLPFVLDILESLSHEEGSLNRKRV